MTITPRALNTNLNDALYSFFTDPLVEGNISFVYKDGAGIPTLGVGYALLTGTPGKHDWILRDYKADLLAAGITLTQTQLDSLNTKLEQARDVLNGKGGSNPFPTGSGTDILGWTITDTQARSLFDKVIPTYITQVKTWLGNDTLYTSLQGSQEMFALVSLAYNGLLSQSPTLKKDILAGNRAEAWYEIRYGSNGGSDPNRGVAKRRYYEAEMFGLYDNPAAKE